MESSVSPTSLLVNGVVHEAAPDAETMTQQTGTEAA